MSHLTGRAPFTFPAGHQWLKSNLGISPKSAWTVDPFGHGPVAPYLLRASGLRNTVVQRIHYGILSTHLLFHTSTSTFESITARAFDVTRKNVFHLRLEAVVRRQTGERLLLAHAVDIWLGRHPVPQLPVRHLQREALVRTRPQGLSGVRFPQHTRRVQW